MTEFRIRDWPRFQHYKKRDEDGKPARRPPWIKAYTKLLDDPAYLGLTGVQRGLLHDLWLWWARMDLGERWTGLNIELFNRLLATNTRKSTWEALNHAGFIEIRASSARGDIRLVARPEVEGEVEQEPSAVDVTPKRAESDSTGVAQIIDLGLRRTG